MPTYNFICTKCLLTSELYMSVKELDKHRAEGTCEACDGPIKQQILSAPATVIPPSMQAAGSDFERKMKYYGITDIKTGAGITQHTNVSEPPGVRGHKSTDPKKP